MDIEQLAKQNEQFRGTVMDEEKAKRLEAMRTMAELAAGANPRVTVDFSPAVNVRPHAGVRLAMPLPLFSTSPIFNRALGELIAAADMVAFARVPENKFEKLLVTCDVRNIWKEE